MKRLVIVAVTLVALITQGCVAQVLGEYEQRGSFVREEATGIITAQATKEKLELVSPLSVRVYEEVEREEATKRYYQKIRVRREARLKDYPLFDTWVKALLATAIAPLFFPSYWVEGSYAGTDCKIKQEKCIIREVPTVSAEEYFVEDGTRTLMERRQNDLRSESVSLFINGYYKSELAISSDGSATADLLLFPDAAATQRPLKLTFKYHNAYAYSTLQKSDVEKIFKKSSFSSETSPFVSGF